MQSSDIPGTKIVLPFANNAGSLTRTIPVTTADPNAASYTLGFPPNTAVPEGAGGKPPDIKDFNGIGNELSAWIRWQNAGAALPYDGVFQAAISGYPRGAVVMSATTFGLWWLSTAENNVTNPDTGGAGWVSFLPTGLQLAHGECVLVRSGGTQLSVLPRNANNVIVAGKQLQIPSAGLNIANTGVTINGTASQNLAINSAYLVALNASGSLEYWTFATGHVTDTTAGNVGVEIISGHGDKTLIGAITTDGSALFNDSPTLRNVANWFEGSRRNKSVAGASPSNTTLTGSGQTQINGAWQVGVTILGPEQPTLAISGAVSIDTGGAAAQCVFGVDGSPTGIGSTATSASANQQNPANATLASELSEGHHILSPFGATSTGTATFSVQIAGTVRN